MKKNYIKSIVFVLILLISNTIFSQKKKIPTSTNKHSHQVESNLTEENKHALEKTGFVRCLTVEHEHDLQKKYPNRLGTEDFENWLAPKIEQFKKDRKSGKLSKSATIFNIPVVIHIIHDGDPVNTIGNIYGENISDAQAISQIDVMNEDYRRMTGTPGGDNTTGLAVDVEINFCLAVQDENGAPTTGIVRHNITPYSNDVSGDGDWETKTDVEQMKTVTQWDPTKYLNMWTFRPGGNSLNNGGLDGLLGYAQFPVDSGLDGLGYAGAANTDGVVAGFDAFGTIADDDGSFTLNNTYNLGRTMTHEVGHYLGLRHTWGDGDCTVDDYCDDTPLTGNANYTCDLTANSCPSFPIVYDMVQNYMDYTNDSCMDTFTQDQKDRMVTVMLNSPRRMELNSSNGCTASSPTIYFNDSGSTETEETSCSYRDISTDLSIALAPSADATITFSQTAGTATEGVDFDFVNSSVVFSSGATDSKTLTIRIYEDSFDEGNETLTIGMSISTTGDAEITTVGNSEYTLTLTDDDERLGTTTPVFTEDFESYTDFDIAPINSWTMLDLDLSYTWAVDSFDFTNEGYKGTFIVFNSTQTSPEATGWEAHGGNKGYYCFSASGDLDNDGNQYDVPALNNDYIFTPQISVTGLESKLKFWAKSITDSYGLERFNVMISTTSNDVASLTTLYPTNPSPGPETYQEAPTTWTEYTYDLSAYDGQDVYVAFHVESADAFVFMLDDISIESEVFDVQTAVNSPDQNALASTGTIYANNDLDNNLVVDITNSNNQNYGCVDAYVSRAFDAANPAVQQQASGVANYVLAKEFTITPSTINSSGNADLVFYFSEEEIQLWENTTGNTRSQLVVYKDNGSTIEQVPATIGAFANHVTITANYTSGINGTYFFGIDSVLNILKNDFNNFNVYPNPSTSNFNLTLSSSENVELRIFDMLGRNVFEKEYQNTSTNFNKVVSPNLSKGVYILKVESGNKKAFQKIIIE